MEQELRLMLRDRAERVRVDKGRRRQTLRTARRRRRWVATTSVLGVAAIVIGGAAIADSWRGGIVESDPVGPPIESPGDEDEPTTDVLVAEARDGTWTMYAGLSNDGETLCLSLEGVGCIVTNLQRGFVVLTSYDGMEEEGFLYGTVHWNVASLELVRSDGDVVPLRPREFPKNLGVEQLRFYVRPLRGQGMGTIVARDFEGDVLQRTDISWGAGRFDSLTLDLELRRSTVTSGGQAQAFLDVRNDSGEPVTDPSCLLASGRFALVPIDDPDAELWQQIVVDCGGPFRIPDGFTDRYGGLTFIARTQQGEPLPPGDYVATLEIEGLSERLSASVEVTE